MSAEAVPAACQVDWSTGVMSGRTGVKRSRIRDLSGLYADETALERLIDQHGNETAYEVQEFRPEQVEPREMIFGTSTVQPGTVGDEFFLTRGHLHERADRPEIYLCQSGHGVLHMESLDGQTHPLEMRPGTVVYVPPYWIHRSVNVGSEPLMMLFCYPADAGQDYGIIERSGGMRTLIADDGNGGWREVKNPRYRPRSPEDQKRYRGSP